MFYIESLMTEKDVRLFRKIKAGLLGDSIYSVDITVKELRGISKINELHNHLDHISKALRRPLSKPARRVMHKLLFEPLCGVKIDKYLTILGIEPVRCYYINKHDRLFISYINITNNANARQISAVEASVIAEEIYPTRVERDGGDITVSVADVGNNREYYIPEKRIPIQGVSYTVGSKVITYIPKSTFILSNIPSGELYFPEEIMNTQIPRHAVDIESPYTVKLRRKLNKYLNKKTKPKFFKKAGYEKQAFILNITQFGLLHLLHVSFMEAIYRGELDESCKGAISTLLNTEVLNEDNIDMIRDTIINELDDTLTLDTVKYLELPTPDSIKDHQMNDVAKDLTITIDDIDLTSERSYLTEMYKHFTVDEVLSFEKRMVIVEEPVLEGTRCKVVNYLRPNPYGTEVLCMCQYFYSKQYVEVYIPVENLSMFSSVIVLKGKYIKTL